MNDNYMKTILSGIKEWTENLTDDAKDKANNAIDKANNALDKANNALDKALFVVNITRNSGGTFSADKTFEEITQAYNEGKYNIVAKFDDIFIFPLVVIEAGYGAEFYGVSEGQIFSFFITSNNEVIVQIIPLATENSKLPNPYPLTFTGAVNETYDGSSAKTIEIPSGGGGGDGDYTNVIRVLEGVSDYAITDIDPSEYSHFIISWSKAASGINFVSVSNGVDVGTTLCTHQNGIAIILLDRSINNGIAVIRMQGNNTSAVSSSCQFISYETSLPAGIHLTGNIPAGAVFYIRGWK